MHTALDSSVSAEAGPLQPLTVDVAVLKGGLMLFKYTAVSGALRQSGGWALQGHRAPGGRAPCPHSPSVYSLQDNAASGGGRRSPRARVGLS